MVRIDVTRATRAIVKSANLSFGLVTLLVVYQIGLMTGLALMNRQDPSPELDVWWFWPVAALGQFVPAALVFVVLYHLVCVLRLVVVTELVALLYGFVLGFFWGCVIVAILVRVGPAPDAVQADIVPNAALPGWFALGLLPLFAGPYVLAAHRFRALRRRLRPVAIELAYRPWRKPAFRQQLRAQSRWQLALAVSLFLAGFLMLQGIWAAWIRPEIDMAVGAAVSVGSLIGAIALMRLGHEVMRNARRRAMPQLSDAVRHDERRPVLFLRSFLDDHLVGKSSRRPLLWPLARQRLGAEGSFEEVLTIALTDVGPVVAIGRPGETRAAVGAAREYLSHDDWQGRVKELIERSALVVILVGGTPGLAWEAERLLSGDVRGRVLFVLPPVGEAEAADRWRRLRQQLVQAKVDLDGLPDDVSGALMFSVGSAHKPGARLYTARGRTLEQYELAFTLAAHECLEGPLPEALLASRFRDRR